MSSQGQILSKRKRLILKFIRLKFNKKETMQLLLFGQMAIEVAFTHIKGYFLNKSLMHDQFLFITFLFFLSINRQFSIKIFFFRKIGFNNIFSFIDYYSFIFIALFLCFSFLSLSCPIRLKMLQFLAFIY